jgi:hypothetical protein
VRRLKKLPKNQMLKRRSNKRGILLIEDVLQGQNDRRKVMTEAKGTEKEIHPLIIVGLKG